MIKETVEYTDYDGNIQKETMYFNLTKAELAELEMEMPQGFSNYLTQIVESGEPNSVFQAFKKIVLLGYGRKTDDGRFVKSVEEAEIFSHTEAYSELMMSLLQSEEKMMEFIKGLLPKDLGPVDEIAPSVV